MSSYNEKKRISNEKWDKENMVQYTVKYSNKIYEAVLQAMGDSGLNRNKWTTNAIIEKLQRDGYLDG